MHTVFCDIFKTYEKLLIYQTPRSSLNGFFSDWIEIVIEFETRSTDLMLVQRPFPRKSKSHCSSPPSSSFSLERYRRLVSRDEIS